jgi:hypothetical protein
VNFSSLRRLTYNTLSEVRLVLKNLLLVAVKAEEVKKDIVVSVLN